MILIPYHPDHLLALTPVPEMEYTVEMVKNPAWRRQYLAPGVSFSVVADGAIQASFGIVPQMPGKGFAWASFDRDIGPRRFSTASRMARTQMEALYPHFFRLEAVVLHGYAQGKRWAELLGFELETECLTNWDGHNDFHGYALWQ